jgi:S1-C subfamily serine protease
VDAQLEKYTNTTTSPDTSLALIELFSKVENSVVQVTATANLIDPYGSSLGSGFVYDKRGHIITNYHVIGPNLKRKRYYCDLLN